ncbi:unnamed protein product [Prunus armeniaca]
MYLAAGAVGKYGQLEQLGAVKKGVIHQPEGRTKLHSINRELHTHSMGRLGKDLDSPILLSFHKQHINGLTIIQGVNNHRLTRTDHVLGLV